MFIINTCKNKNKNKETKSKIKVEILQLFPNMTATICVWK